MRVLFIISVIAIFLCIGIAYWYFLWNVSGWIGVSINLAVIAAVAIYIRYADVEDHL